MNKKGQMTGVGLMLGLFIGIIVAVSLLSGGIYENIGTVTQTRNLINSSAGVFAPVTVLQGQAVSNVVVTNRSGFLIPSSNYTITNYDVSTGTLRAYLTNLSGPFGGQNINVTYTYEPLGYATNSGARSLMSLIAIFAAIAIIVIIAMKIKDGGWLDYFD